MNEHDETMTEVEDAALDYALRLLFAKGSEGDGELHLNKTETHALCEYVRGLRRGEDKVTVVVNLDGAEVARHIITPAADLA